LTAEATEGMHVAKYGAEKWKNMEPSQKAPWEKKAADMKTEYEKQLEEFKNQGGVMARISKKPKGEAGSKRGSAKAKLKGGPKKPAGGGYGVYLNEHRKEIVASLPPGHKITDVSKAAGVKWKTLSAAQKKPYEEKYAKKAAEYKIALEEFKKSAGAAAEAANGQEAEEDEEAAEEDEEADDAEEAEEEVDEAEEEEAEPEPPALKRARPAAHGK